jgi:hypothetical protein
MTAFYYQGWCHEGKLPELKYACGLSHAQAPEFNFTGSF